MTAATTTHARGKEETRDDRSLFVLVYRYERRPRQLYYGGDDLEEKNNDFGMENDLLFFLVELEWSWLILFYVLHFFLDEIHLYNNGISRITSLYFSKNWSMLANLFFTFLDHNNCTK